MRCNLVTVLCAAGMLFGLALQVGGQTPVAPIRDSLIGKRVMVIAWSAELKVENTVVGRVRLGQFLKVSHAQGAWLWIKEAGGWIERKNVVPADKALDYFTTNVNRNLTAEAYHQRALAYAAFKQFEKALADLNTVLARDSRNWAAYNDRGNVHRNLGHPKQAVADFNRVLTEGKPHPAVYTNRGLAWLDLKDYDRALADFNAAIQLDAKFAPAWEAAGTLREAQGNYDRAIRNYNQALALDGRFAEAYNDLAWLLATCPADKFRDGRRAVEYATKACELTGFQDAGMLDTLAAALAEAGQFPQAVRRASEAVALAGPDKKPAIEKRLALYRSGKAFRQTTLSP